MMAMTKRGLRSDWPGVVLAALMAAGGCGNGSSPGVGADAGGGHGGSGGGSGGGGVVADAASDADFDGDGPSDVAADGGGDNVIAGSIKGHPFDKIVSAFWIGRPDSPKTTVIYLFDGAFTCKSLQGDWAAATRNLQFAEIKLFGTTPAAYKITTSRTPVAGEAAFDYSLNSTMPGTPSSDEILALSGTVTADAFNKGVDLVGSFDADFGSSVGKLQGTFRAAWCAGGMEP